MMTTVNIHCDKDDEIECKWYYYTEKNEKYSVVSLNDAHLYSIESLGVNKLKALKGFIDEIIKENDHEI